MSDVDGYAKNILIWHMLLKEFSADIRRENVSVPRDQGIVNQFNRTLGERLLPFQYSLEMNFTSGKRSTEWVKCLSDVVSHFNGQVTRLTEKLVGFLIIVKHMYVNKDTSSKILYC